MCLHSSSWILGNRTRRSLVLVALSLTCVACQSSPPVTSKPASPASALVLLANDRIEVGILPAAGGRAVLLRRPGHANVLLSDPALWPQEPPKPAIDAPWVDYGGHIVWVGPQADWWLHQDLDAARRARKTPWPPDPWIEFGRFEIVRRSESSVRLKGPASPITGLRMIKTYTLAEDGVVSFHVVAENTRDTPVCWSLWSNTRMPASARGYGQPEVGKTFRLTYESPTPSETVPLGPLMVDGVFTFDLPETHGEWTAASGKAFFIPVGGWVAGAAESDVYVKRFEPASATDVPIGQAPAEIYQILKTVPVLELECHSAQRTLQPGERMEWSETWQVVAYDGPNRPKDHVRFLRRLNAAGSD